jgi:hypothetical protein
LPPLLTSQPKKLGIGDAERRYDLEGWNGQVRAGALKADVDPPFPLGKGHPQHPLPSDGVGRPKERWDETEVWGLGKNRVSPSRFAWIYARRAEPFLHKPLGQSIK